MFFADALRHLMSCIEDKKEKLFRLLGVLYLPHAVVSVEGPGGTPPHCCSKRLLGWRYHTIRFNLLLWYYWMLQVRYNLFKRWLFFLTHLYMYEIFGFLLNLLKRIRIINIYVLHIIHLSILYLKVDNMSKIKMLEEKNQV